MHGARLLGVVEHGTITLESEDESSVLMDFVRAPIAAMRYLKETSGLSSAQRIVLQAFTDSFTSLFRVQERNPHRGVHLASQTTGALPGRPACRPR